MSTGKLQISQIVGNHNTLYERLYTNCFPDFDGNVTSQKAAELLKKSGLDEILLSKIWNLSDSGSKGKLSRYEFFISLKLVALAQSGYEAKLDNLHLQIQAPRLTSCQSPLLDNLISTMSVRTGSPSTSSLASTSSLGWTIGQDEQTKYSQLFDSLNPVNNKLSGDVVKPVLLNSKLPMPVLGRVWMLSDLDADGQLDRDEFVVAMHLVYRALGGQELPTGALPPGLVPPSKRRPGSVVPTSTPMHVQAPIPWVVGKLEKEQYDSLFHTADMDRDGLVTGLEVRATLVQSGLSQTELARIWDLCDTAKCGKLNSEQFALAMHLVNEHIKSAGSRPIPSCLSPEMVPPSMRAGVLSSDAGGGQQTLTLASFGIRAESDGVYREIEALRKERLETEGACRRLEAEVASAGAEAESVAAALASSRETASALSAQAEEARGRLEALEVARSEEEAALAEVRARCGRERSELEAVRARVRDEAAGADQRRERLKSAQAELAELVRKEAEAREDGARARLRLAELDRESATTEKAVSTAEARVTRLEDLKQRLRTALEQLDAVLAGDGGDAPLPDEKELDKLLSADLQSDNKAANQTSVLEWPSPTKDKPNSSSLAAAALDDDNDPFMKNDPFSMVGDPFAANDPFFPAPDDYNLPPQKSQPTTSLLTDDPFGVGPAPLPHDDPFTNQDPFSANGWGADNDQNAAFSVEAIDDFFKNMTTNDTTVTTRNKPDATFGFGDSAFSAEPAAVTPSAAPPRPSKGPGKLQSQAPAGSSEREQLAWARTESEREARERGEARRREAADLELAIKLSQSDSATVPPSSSRHHKNAAASGSKTRIRK